MGNGSLYAGRRGAPPDHNAATRPGIAGKIRDYQALTGRRTRFLECVEKRGLVTIGRLFIATHEFDRQWERMGLEDEDRRRLENEIVNNPQIGAVIRGTGGLRKMRFSFEGRGKSGSSRVLYVDFVVFGRIYLITAYPKSAKENISPAEREIYRKVIEMVKKELGGRRS
ncbi:MAG: type II toxin-antitoxin system RelE/ParE family toxin [Clostridiales bacterium]|nr:type II toxin-antitoxin system RelE/ParE family toxin [Clostridiales bacterium]